VIQVVAAVPVFAILISMRRLFAAGAVAAILVLGASAGHADRSHLKDPFKGSVDSEAIRALPSAKLKDPFARVGASRAVRALRETSLKNPFATPAPARPDTLPELHLKNPFAR